MLDISHRWKLMERFWAQAEGPPVSVSKEECERGNDDEPFVMTFNELKALIEEYCVNFLHLTRHDQDVDMAIWASDLLQYFNGPKPDIEILPQGDSKPSLFRVTIQPE